MLFFQNLVDETQMPKPQKYTDIFILTKKLFIVGLQGLQNISIPVERPCIILHGLLTVLAQQLIFYYFLQTKKGAFYVIVVAKPTS